MRLIDADALLKEYEGAFAYKMLKEIIENAPTVNRLEKENQELKEEIEELKTDLYLSNGGEI